jgi:plasmid stability protein
MAVQNITVSLPEELYEQLQQRAAQSHRSVEAELVEVVSSVMPVAARLTPDLKERLAQLRFLDDTALWQVARRTLSKRTLTRLRTLNAKRQREGLTEAEDQKANELAREYERIVLVRSQAIGLLKERGHDITEFQPDA